MDRDSFNSLPISKQIGYFNGELTNEENNFNAICRNLGISKNTILNRFKANGFEPLKAGQKIIRFSQQCGKDKNSQQAEKETTAQNTVFKNLTAENSEVKNIRAENSALINLNSKKLPLKNKSKVNDPEDISLILKRIELLEKKVEKYDLILSQPKEYENAIFRSDKNFISSYNDTVSKTFKIDVEVYQELEKVFDKYKMYKRQDIVSSLLKYALDNIE